jgi:hypothetical protein
MCGFVQHSSKRSHVSGCIILIMYLEGYLDGCWMYALTILCMASV